MKEEDNRNYTVPIDRLYGLENKKVDEFNEDKKLNNMYFIFAPSLYLYDQAD